MLLIIVMHSQKAVTAHVVTVFVHYRIVRCGLPVKQSSGVSPLNMHNISRSISCSCAERGRASGTGTAETSQYTKKIKRLSRIFIRHNISNFLSIPVLSVTLNSTTCNIII